MGRMWFKFFDRFGAAESVSHETVQLGSHSVPLVLVRHPRARRYLMRLGPDGKARVTIPRRGTLAAAREFVERHRRWLEREFQLWQAQPRQPARWQIGSVIWFRGAAAIIESAGPAQIRLGNATWKVADPAGDLRPTLERHLRQLATRELPARAQELARSHGFVVKSITVRNQRTRWGSCSRRGALSLNWRLIQAPEYVRDYIILHELAHLRQMNHSRRFWAEVERLCPEYRTAERWLKEHRLLH